MLSSTHYRLEYRADARGLRFVTAYRTAFPDLKVKIEAEFGEGDMIAHRLTSTGTMKGEFMGMKPTVKTGTWEESHIGRFDSNGKVVEHWGT